MGKRQEIQLDLFSEQSDKVEAPPTSPEYRIACSDQLPPDDMCGDLFVQTGSPWSSFGA